MWEASRSILFRLNVVLPFQEHRHLILKKWKETDILKGLVDPNHLETGKSKYGTGTIG